jgi:hypothetical protein
MQLTIKGLEQKEEAHRRNASIMTQQPVVKKRLPVTLQQLRVAATTEGLWTQTDGGGGRLLYCCLAMQYFLLARRSEMYATAKGKDGKGEYVLCRFNLCFIKGEEELLFERRREADHAVVTWLGYKGEKAHRNAQLAYAGQPLEMLNALLDTYPELPMEAPLTAYPRPGGGHSVVTADEATAALHRMMRALGVGHERLKLYQLHSLRVGGATALRAAGATDDQIMKAGRWASLCFKEYIHCTREEGEEISAMLGGATARRSLF